MKSYLHLKSRSAKWAVGFGIALVVLTVLSLVFAVAIGGNPAVIDNSPVLSALAAALSVMFTLAGPLSFFVGIYVVVRHREWAVIKILAVLYILTLVLFALGEFLFPH